MRDLWALIENGDDGPYIKVSFSKEKARKAFDKLKDELKEHIIESSEDEEHKKYAHPDYPWFRFSSDGHLVEITTAVEIEEEDAASSENLNATASMKPTAWGYWTVSSGPSG